MRRIETLSIKKFISALAVVLLGHSISAWSAHPSLSPDQTVGSVNCANSLCHGSITPWSESNVLQNEYTTWERLDKHTQTYQVLLNKQSKLIAKNLGLEKPAHESKVCLDCHAHNPPANQRGLPWPRRALD